MYADRISSTNAAQPVSNRPGVTLFPPRHEPAVLHGFTEATSNRNPCAPANATTANSPIDRRTVLPFSTNHQPAAIHLKRATTSLNGLSPKMLGLYTTVGVLTGQ